MRPIYLFTSIVALGAAATHCSSDPEAPPTGTGGSAPTGGASSAGAGAPLGTGGAIAGSGGATVTGGTSSGGNVSSGGAAKGGATSGGAASGGASGGGLSGGNAGLGGAVGGVAGKAGGGAAGTAGAGGGAAGGGGKATGGAAGTAGASGSGGGTTATFAAVTMILEMNCGNACHKADNGKGHVVLNDNDKGLYARLTMPLPTTTQDCKGGILANPAKASDSILPIVVEKGISAQFGCDDVPHMPYMCGTGGGAPPCLSKGDIATIQAWVNAGSPKG